VGVRNAGVGKGVLDEHRRGVQVHEKPAMKTDQIGADNGFLCPNPFFLLGFGVDRILYRFGYKCRFFRMLEMVRTRTGVGVEADFFKLDTMCLHVVFYDKKQFINQCHKAAIQLEIITINPPPQFKSSQN
jgi:hypothetical protein